MDTSHQTQAVLLSHTISDVKETDSNIYVLPNPDTSVSVVPALFREIRSFFAKTSSKDGEKIDNYVITNCVDGNNETLKRELIFRTSKIDFFQDQKIESMTSLLNNTLNTIKKISENLGGEVH